MSNNTDKKEPSEVSKREEEILQYWNNEQIFEKGLSKESSGEFTFYDGPPFATGLPHYGHLLVGTIKDVIPRYQTMKGKHVTRRWGWDCHGLPLEAIIEKELGVETKKDIEDMGIKVFNEAARDAVLRYAEDWKRIVPRMGRFIDMENDYRTMDAGYTESVWWVFKRLYDKGLIYKGYKSMHISPILGTGLSNFEVAQGYKDITDISITAKFALKDEKDTFVLAWTTTPWTLFGNVALAVGKEVTYCKLKTKNSKLKTTTQNSKLKDGEIYILAKERLEDVVGDEPYEVIEEMKGADLVGKGYEPLFDFYSKDKKLENHENGWKIYEAEFVTTEDGTGVVHIAPAFGEDDLNLGKEKELPFVQHVKMDGSIKDEIKGFAGLQAKPKDDPTATDVEVLKALAHEGKLFSKEKFTHSYPHSWRTDEPLLNYAMESWFVKVPQLRDKLLEENKNIRWVPKEVGQYRFGNWLEGARDWAISRARFWGAPMPIWLNKKTGEQHVLGSVDDLKKHLKTNNNHYFVLRHGQSESNVRHEISNRAGNDDNLTELGRKQVSEGTEKLKDKNIDVIYASSFVRTEQTAEIIAETLGISKSKIVYDDRLWEVNTGPDLNHKSISEYWDLFADSVERFMKRVPGGENLNEMKRRLARFIYDTDAEHENKNILIVTHEYSSWLLHAVVQGMNAKQAVALKDERGDDYLGNGEFEQYGFVALPHNDLYELDLHRPYIDDIELFDADGEALERIPDVFDCWFESGAMPYGQKHYPFETNGFDPEKGVGYPADFISEALDQTRGWFYSLLVLGVALFDKTPYRNVVVTGLILAEDGRKMSKKLQNYPDPVELANTYGADAIRYYMMQSPVVHAEDLNFSEKGVAEVYRKVIMRLLNSLTFLETYTEGEKLTAPERPNKVENALDAWILTRLDELISTTTDALDAYELNKATRPIGDFVDDLSTWYIRRSRDRFKSDDVNDRKAAIETTRYVLSELAKVAAPILPFTAEHLYRVLHDDEQRKSVHLESWPERSKEIDMTILETMATARAIVAGALEVRAEHAVKVRQPLQKLTISDVTLEKNDALLSIIADELNVKEVVVDRDAKVPLELDLKLTDALRQEGEVRELVRSVQNMRKKAGMKPGQKAVLTVDTDDAGQTFLNALGSELQKVATIEKIVHETRDGGTRIVIGDKEFTMVIDSA